MVINEKKFYWLWKRKPQKFFGLKKQTVSIIVNIEESAELSISSGDSQNEHVYENNKIKILNIPDLCMESHFEYGLRSGTDVFLRF